MPVVMCSSLTEEGSQTLMQALEAGAVDVILLDCFMPGTGNITHEEVAACVAACGVDRRYLYSCRIRQRRGRSADCRFW